MKNEKLITKSRMIFLLSFLVMFCFTIGYAQSPLDRMVQEKGNFDLTLSIENERIQSNEFKTHVKNYVLFNYDSQVAREIKTDNPKAIELVVPTTKGNVTLQLVQDEITSPDYRIETSSGAPGFDAPIGKHYKGIVKGENGSLAAVSFFDGEISVLASTKSKGNFTINKIESDGDDRYISYYDSDLKTQNSFECHTEEPEFVPEFLQNQKILNNIQSQRGGGPCIRVHFEADNGLYNSKQQSIANTAAYIEAIFNQVTTLYTAENINVVISYIKVWDTPDNFQGANSSETIDNFQAYFLTGADLNGDLGHLAAIDPGGNGGIARGIDVLCTSDDNQLAYSDISSSFQNVPNYSFTVMVFTHEMGHNLGSPHTHGCYWNGNGTQIDDCGNNSAIAAGNTPEGSSCYNGNAQLIPPSGGTIMSYCHTDNNVGINFTEGFGLQPGNLIRSLVNGSACLSACPIFSECVPPYHLELNNIGLTSVDVSWFHETETTFDVVIASENDTIIQTVNGTSVILAGLEEGTQYDITVNTICDNPSESEGVAIDFSTLCDEIYSLPYVELFEGSTWEVSSYELDPCWTSEISSSYYGWSVNKFETSSVDTGPLGDHTTGFGKYVYAEASIGNTGDEAALITPLIDLTGANGAFATYWYHMFGATVTKFDVFVKESGEDWELLQTFIGAQQDSISEDWKQDQILLDDYEGKIIQLKFTSTKGADFAGDIAIDDLIVSDSSLIDLAVLSISSPESDCGLGVAESAFITLRNNGFQTIFAGTQINLEIDVTQNPSITENFILSIDLEPNRTINHAFQSSFDLSNPGEYLIGVEVDVAGDQIEGNNYRFKTVVNKPVISHYPYTQSFESYSDWTVNGIESSWALGTPAKSKIIGASDGENAWVTGGLGLDPHNSDEESYLEGPCFDFTNLENGVISFDVWWEIETIWDGATFQYSTNQGQLWQVLGSAEDDNWFNADTVTVFPGNDGWTGTNDGDDTFDGSEGWVNVSHDLSFLDGEPSVFFRVVFKSDPAVENDGIGIDNFIVDGDFTPPGCSYIVIEETTCNHSEVGVVSETFQDINECDSTITTITTFAPSHDIVIETKVCDILAVGVDIESFTTSEGCDSIVTTNYVFAESYNLNASITSCDENDVGFETLHLVSEYGCDSIVNVTTTFEPSEADFNFTIVGAQVIFSDASNFGTDFSWNFGDGNTSASQNPTHTFDASDVFEVELIVSADGCESDTVTKEVDVVVSGIDIISFIESIQIYPNPNRGNFTVEINGANIYKDLQFTLFDVTGSLVDSRAVSFKNQAKETYALNNLSNGVYFLRIQSENQISSYKINILR